MARDSVNGKAGAKSEDGPENTNEIKAFLHCSRCIQEWTEKAPGTAGTSPAEYARLSVGWTQRGIQVWCERHDLNVIHVDFEGHKHKANLTAKKG